MNAYWAYERPILTCNLYHSFFVVQATGRIGINKASLKVWQNGSKLRIDCDNNPEFWLVFDTVTLETQGRSMSSVKPSFVASKTAYGYRIDDSNNPAFWLAIKCC